MVDISIAKFFIVVSEVCILNQISQKFVPKGPVDDKAALVQIVAWPQMRNDPLSEPMIA